MEYSRSFIDILTGSDLSRRSLPLIILDSGVPGPTVWLTACIHGDEVGGIVTIQEIFDYLKQHPLQSGKLCSFPLMNPMGFESMSRNIPATGEDLNRCFPGDEKGTLAQRIACKTFSHILQSRPDLVIDLHNDWTRSVPYAVIDPFPGEKHRAAYRKTREYCRKSGFLIIDEGNAMKEHRHELSHSLTGSLLRHDVPAVTMELGESNVVNEQWVREGLCAILNVLAYMGMSGQPTLESYQTPKKFRNRILDYQTRPVPQKSGLVRYQAQPGKEVRKGETIAIIVNVVGEVMEELKAREDGIVLAHADSSVAIPGKEIYAFGCFKSSTRQD